MWLLSISTACSLNSFSAKPRHISFTINCSSVNPNITSSSLFFHVLSAFNSLICHYAPDYGFPAPKQLLNKFLTQAILLHYTPDIADKELKGIVVIIINRRKNNRCIFNLYILNISIIFNSLYLNFGVVKIIISLWSHRQFLWLSLMKRAGSLL